ncbi:MAG: hypothetical protein ACTHMS_16735 [Jatrophihabitans sp.]
MFVVLLRYGLRRSAIGVVRALRANPGQPYRVTVHKWAISVGAWNPGQPLRRNGQVFGDGTAVYRLVDGDLVELVWTPRDGHEQRFSGEVPKQVDVDGPAHRRRKAVVRGILAGYLALAAAGFTVGYLASSGTAAHRAGIGFGGVFLAMASVWVLVTLAAAVHGSRSALSTSRRRLGT